MQNMRCAHVLHSLHPESERRRHERADTMRIKYYLRKIPLIDLWIS